MQAGVHLLAGLLMCLLFPRHKSIGAAAGDARLGCVLGAILPDADIPVTVLMVALSGNYEVADIYHRTVTHSIVFALLCFAIMTIFADLVRAHIQKDKLWFIARTHPVRRHVFEPQAFGTGLVLGLISHAVLDMMYLKGVAIWWPFSDARVGYPLFGYWTTQTELTVKLLEASDHYTDVLFFFIPVMVVANWHQIHTAQWNQIVGYCVAKCAVTTAFIILAFIPAVSFETFFTLLYIPGTFFFTISVIAPLLFRDAVRRFGDPTVPQRHA
ncbi:hypothetical protein CAOG_06893 [Capsaspora owczarzaki ATCC 30864]|uniref:Metal-dependent hydrolase n=1 Tax=Capsaspora owczarzaki (strain ATCC 30864) TaxID=595528 RepID=A0A0D2VY44_CAPO3|nr:hypothetical protein CAOG_06893 [Capsaspora owczarzaki ATCC 30864]KJE96592.1 hypothetical protein CAOG_006893 [Capsaspora owczarzaki ATCC 30864]|eukprot:XP_004344514.1 hypothetical protein CAOG_06893 [Capsaspora owczarzaki ATCC 30864]